ncbi:MAG: O-antigen polymerase [Steroidobacteraceae bacterium]
MYWCLTLVPLLLIAAVHFGGQRRQELCFRSSNYWVAFYVAGYFLPIPMFAKGSDGWSETWGYAFSTFDDSLMKAVALATIGGLILSLSSTSYQPDTNTLGAAARTRRPIAISRRADFSISGRRIAALAAVCLGALFVGVRLVGGVWFLVQNLGDRINLFAGLNAFFLPLNMLIGMNFAIAAVRAVGNKFPAAIEAALLVTTLGALMLMGQKANLFILVLGIAIIKMLPRGGVGVGWLSVAALLGANALMIYEFVFREAISIGVDPERLTVQGWLGYLIPQITGNLMQIQNLTVLVEGVPATQPYLFGATYIAFFTLILPQSLVAAKPLAAAGVHTLAFWPEVVIRESTTMPPGLFGEAYLNFGPAGFLALCALVGLLLRYVERPFMFRKGLSAMSIVRIASAGAMSLHFIRGEFFSPFLILVGILAGARLVMIRHTAAAAAPLVILGESAAFRR